ncbi:hypothetical protein M3Y94_00406000 [Aphelenchoides besseyi]|nr:hypothetical protein M3Y94_00406000 [Aphelenchoides besseyi]KAI6217789.1 Decapping nuclease [Aphelenchoides besseyi]
MDSSKANFPAISKPAFVGDFGTDFLAQKVKPGRSGLRYLYEKALREVEPKDLKLGYETYRSKPDVEERLDGMLRYLIEVSEPGTELRKIVHDADFVTWRGTLTRIGSTPFDTVETGNGWKIACIKLHDVIFLCEYQTDLKKKKEGTADDFQRLQTYGGFKLEQYLTTERKNGLPDTSAPVSTCENYSAVFKLDIGTKYTSNHVGIFMGAEIDGIDSSGRFIEIKSQFRGIGHGRFWSSKEMKWWLQSFLVGIERLIVGIKENQSVVKKVMELNNSDLARNRTGKWTPATCVNFLHSYLQTVRIELNKLPEGTILLTEQFPQEKWTHRVVSHEEKPLYNFLLPEFVQHFNLLQL